MIAGRLYSFCDARRRFAGGGCGVSFVGSCVLCFPLAFAVVLTDTSELNPVLRFSLEVVSASGGPMLDRTVD